MATGWDDAGGVSADGWDQAPAALVEDLGEGDWDAGAENDSDGTIRLGQKPDASHLRDALLALPALNAARIDASEVERLPGPAFQVLLVAMRDALQDGGRIKVINPSFAFGLCFEAFGLGGDLEPFAAEYV